MRAIVVAALCAPAATKEVTQWCIKSYGNATFPLSCEGAHTSFTAGTQCTKVDAQLGDYQRFIADEKPAQGRVLIRSYLDAACSKALADESLPYDSCMEFKSLYCPQGCAETISPGPCAAPPSPTPPPAPTPCKDIVALAQSVKDLSTLVTAVVAGGLVDTLKSPGPFTVFAPTNEAFAALPNGTLEKLLKPENKAQLDDILTYHVLAAKVLSTDLKDGQTAKTVEGGNVTVHIFPSGAVEINDATVKQADVLACNGVVHIIDAVLLPPTGL